VCSHQRGGWQGRRFGAVQARERLRVGAWRSEVGERRWLEFGGGVGALSKSG